MNVWKWLKIFKVCLCNYIVDIQKALIESIWQWISFQQTNPVWTELLLRRFNLKAILSFAFFNSKQKRRIFRCKVIKSTEYECCTQLFMWHPIHAIIALMTKKLSSETVKRVCSKWKINFWLVQCLSVSIRLLDHLPLQKQKLVK